MQETAARRAADALLAQHEAGVQFRPFRADDGLAAIADAYDIQEKYVDLLRGEHGEAIGYKVGLTSQAMQTFCGIDHPIAGVVLAGRVLASGATVRRSAYGRLGLEFEIAVRIKSDMPAVTFTPTTIAPYIDGVCAAIEVVDDRNADYANLEVRSVVADNSWSAGIVLSAFASAWPDLEAMPGKARKDTSLIGEGHGRDILGHPFNSVAWLNSQLASRGGALKSGQIVMTGSVMKTIFPAESATYRFDLEGLGSVEVRVAL